MWSNFKFYAMVELGAILLVKLNRIFLQQMLCASGVHLRKGLVNLTKGEGEKKYVKVVFDVEKWTLEASEDFLFPTEFGGKLKKILR